MITLKDLTLLINHLSEANRLFDNEATMEERKQEATKENSVYNNMRSMHEPRSVTLHNKAIIVSTLEKELLQECDHAIVNLEENTIYSARELIAESVYPWINRREPPIEYINTLLQDKTFIPFSYGLPSKKEKLLKSDLHILMLPQEIKDEIQVSFETSKIRKDMIITIGDLFSLGIENESSLFSRNATYKTKLILFRLYILGLMENKNDVYKKRLK